MNEDICYKVENGKIQLTSYPPPGIADTSNAKYGKVMGNDWPSETLRVKVYEYFGDNHENPRFVIEVWSEFGTRFAQIVADDFLEVLAALKELQPVTDWILHSPQNSPPNYEEV